MIYNQFLNNTTRTWLLADGDGQSNISLGACKQTPGKPMLLSVDPKGHPYLDPYWYLQLGPQVVSEIQYDMWFKFPTAQDQKRSQALENECDYISKGLHYDTGIQAEFDKGVWRTFDLPSKHWVETKIGLPGWSDWVTGVEVVSVCSIVQPSFLGFGGGVRYEGLWVNGKWNPLGVFSKCEKVPGKADHFNMAVQADGNSHGDAYSCEMACADVRIK